MRHRGLGEVKVLIDQFMLDLMVEDSPLCGLVEIVVRKNGLSGFLKFLGFE